MIGPDRSVIFLHVADFYQMVLVFSSHLVDVRGPMQSPFSSHILTSVFFVTELGTQNLFRKHFSWHSALAQGGDSLKYMRYIIEILARHS